MPCPVSRSLKYQVELEGFDKYVILGKFIREVVVSPIQTYIVDLPTWNLDVRFSELACS